MDKLPPLVPITRANAHQVKLLRRLSYGAFTSLSWSSNEEIVAVSSTKGIWLHNADALEQPPEQLQKDVRSVHKIDFSPDSERLASAEEDGVIRIWYLPSRSLAGELTGHEGKVLTVKFSPDGKRLFSGGSDGMVRVWDMETFSQITKLPCETAPSSLNSQADKHAIVHIAISLDYLIACGESKTRIFIFDLATFTPKIELDTDIWNVSGLILINNGKTLIARTYLEKLRGYQLWDLDMGLLEDKISIYITNPIPHSEAGIWILEFSENYGISYLKNTKTGQILKASEFETKHSVFSQDKAQFIAYDYLGVIRKFDSETRKNLSQSKVSYNNQQGYPIFSKESATLGVAGYWSGGIQLWDLQYGDALGSDNPRMGSGRENDGSFYSFDAKDELKLVYRRWSNDLNVIEIRDVLKDAQIAEFKSSQDNQFAVIKYYAVNPSWRLLAMGTEYGTVYLWDVESNKRGIIWQKEGYRANCVCFSPDGSLLAIIVSKTRDVTVTESKVLILDVLTREEIFSVVGFKATFSPDSRYLFITCRDKDYQIQIWDIQNNRKKGLLPTSSPYEKDLYFSADHNVLVIARATGLELWDWKKQEKLIFIPEDTYILGAAISPDGKLIATVLGNSGEVHLYGVSAEKHVQ